MFRDDSVLGRMAVGLARTMAAMGGMMLIALIGLIVVSVAGRALLWLGLKPVRGDYELVEVGIGFAVFAFLPLAHLTRGHAVVTLLTDRFPATFTRWILVVTDFFVLIAAGFIAWRLWFGMLDRYARGETTQLLRMPLAWPYTAAFICALGFALVAAYVWGRSMANAVAGRNEIGPVAS